VIDDYECAETARAARANGHGTRGSAGHGRAVSHRALDETRTVVGDTREKKE